MRRKLALGICLFAGIAGVLAAAHIGCRFYQKRRATVLSAKEAARQQVVGAASEINAELERLAGLVETLSEELGTGRLAAEDRDLRLTAIMRNNPSLFKAGVAYESDSSHHPLAVRVVRSGDSLKREDALDDTEADWLAAAVKNESGWSEPVRNESDRVTLASCFAPCSQPGPGRESAGVAFLTLSLDRVAERLASLDLGETGFAAVISKEGYVLVHPDQALVRNHVNIFQLPEVQSNELVRVSLEAARKGESPVIETKNRMTGQDTWFFLEPVPATGWSMMVTLIKDEIRFDARETRRAAIQISVCAVVGLTLVASSLLVGLFFRQSKESLLWVLTAFASVVLLAAFLLIRQVVFSQPSEDDVESVTVLDRSGLNTFLQSQARQNAGGEPVVIPTGILLQSMKFIGAEELFITGYVWQKYSARSHADVSPGFVLPDAVNPRITEAYRRKEGTVETIGWHLETTLKQRMNVSRYPLDHDDVSIRLWHKELEGDVLLAPDLTAYQLLNPTARPGLEKHLNLPGWDIGSSFFDYRFADSAADLGIGGRFSHDATLELRFNVRIKRYLLDVFVSQGIPLLIVLVMLFAVLVTATKDEEQSKLLGFNPSGILSIGSALFFIVLEP
jgi:hypothetical protein